MNEFLTASLHIQSADTALAESAEMLHHNLLEIILYFVNLVSAWVDIFFRSLPFLYLISMFLVSKLQSV